MDKGLAKTGSTLSLVGGIIGIVMGLFVFIASFIIKAYMFAGLFILLSAILVIIGSVKMKNKQKCSKWSIVIIIFSLIGGGTIFGLIGGILGIIAAKR